LDVTDRVVITSLCRSMRWCRTTRMVQRLIAMDSRPDVLSHAFVSRNMSTSAVEPLRPPPILDADQLFGEGEVR
jgi:hypothetical protein